jgi:elongation factor G
LARNVETEARFIRQSGGRGQFAVAWVRFEAVPTEGGGFEFVDGIKGGSIPREFIPAVEKGLTEGFNSGGRTGFPFVNVRATLFDGKYHDVDSSELNGSDPFTLQ